MKIKLDLKEELHREVVIAPARDELSYIRNLADYIDSDFIEYRNDTVSFRVDNRTTRETHSKHFNGVIERIQKMHVAVLDLLSLVEEAQDNIDEWEEEQEEKKSRREIKEGAD